MEVKREAEVEVKPFTFCPSQIENKSCMKVWVKAEPCEDEHDASDLTQGYMNTQEPGCECACESKYERSGVSLSSEEEGNGNPTIDGLVKQEDFEFGKGVVVMRGENFVVELDPNYESGDEVEMKSEVKVECEMKVEYEVKVECESESGEMEMCVDSSGDVPGVPSYRQGSACLASSGEAAVDVRGRCGSSERSVRSSCGQPCVGAAVSAPSTASSSWQANFVEYLQGANVSGQVQRNSVSESGCEGEESEMCPGCGKEGLPCPVCMDVSGENLSGTESAETVQSGRGRECASSQCGEVHVFEKSGDVSRPFLPVHRGEKNLSCSDCGKAFCESSSLRKHFSAVHEGEKKFSCSICGKAFSQGSTLKTHVSTVHRRKENFPCSECDKTFCYEGNLKNHLASEHCGENKLLCRECGKAFAYKGTLKRHVATVHCGEKKFSCSECGKAFGQKSNLKIHLATVHMNEKKFSCSECGKAFGEKGTLKNHLASVHCGEKKFSCSECGKAYFRKSNLNTHVATVHRGEKKFPCSECDKAFGFSYDLKRHMTTVHR